MRMMDVTERIIRCIGVLAFFIALPILLKTTGNVALSMIVSVVILGVIIFGGYWIHGYQEGNISLPLPLQKLQDIKAKKKMGVSITGTNLETTKNVVIIEPTKNIVEETPEIFLKLINAFNSWKSFTSNTEAFISGEKTVIQKIYQLNINQSIFTITSQSIQELLEMSMIKKSPIVVISASIQRLVTIRQRLNKSTFLIFIPMEESFFLPVFSKSETPYTRIYDRGLLQFVPQRRWWLSQPDLLHDIPYFQGESAEGYIHEISFLKNEIVDLMEDAKNQQVEEILAYASKRFFNHHKVINLYGIYYTERARNESEGTPIRGPYLSLAEEKFKTAIALQPMDTMNHCSLGFLYALSNQIEKLEELCKNFPPSVNTELNMIIRTDAWGLGEDFYKQNLGKYISR